MIVKNDSLINNIQIVNDCTSSKAIHANDNVHPQTNLNKPTFTSDTTSKLTRDKNIENSHQIIIKNQKDSGNSILYFKTYSYEPWNNIISVNSKIYKSINKEKVVYNVNENSTISIVSKLTKEVPHLNFYQIASSNITLIFILISFILFAWVKISFNKYLEQLIRAIINYSDEAKLFNDHNIIIDRLYLLLNAIFIFTGGLFIFYFIKYFNHNLLINKSFLLLILCFCSIISVYVYRYVIIKVFGFILNKKQVFNEYLHSTFMYYKATGLFLLPFVFTIYVISENYKIVILIIGALIIFILYFISIFRATRIMLQKGILLFYWILYLCTVEFLPIILLYKLINSRV